MIRPNRALRAAAVLATASLALTACGSSSDNNAPARQSSPTAQLGRPRPRVTAR